MLPAGLSQQGDLPKEVLISLGSVSPAWLSGLLGHPQGVCSENRLHILAFLGDGGLSDTHPGPFIGPSMPWASWGPSPRNTKGGKP